MSAWTPAPPVPSEPVTVSIGLSETAFLISENGIIRNISALENTIEHCPYALASAKKTKKRRNQTVCSHIDKLYWFLYKILLFYIKERVPHCIRFADCWSKKRTQTKRTTKKIFYVKFLFAINDRTTGLMGCQNQHFGYLNMLRSTGCIESSISNIFC